MFHTAEDVLAAVREELNDPAHEGVEHHNLKTYNDGCRGPLCRKRVRDYGRDRYRATKAVPSSELHKPTVRTQWGDLLESQPRRLAESA